MMYMTPSGRRPTIWPAHVDEVSASVESLTAILRRIHVIRPCQRFFTHSAFTQALKLNINESAKASTEVSTIQPTQIGSSILCPARPH